MSAPYLIGDSCLCWSFGEGIDELTVRKTLHIYDFLKKSLSVQDAGVLDIVPSYKSIAVHFDALSADYGHIRNKIGKLIEFELENMDRSNDLPELPGREIIIPVVYDGEDLALVAEHCGFSTDEVIKRHSAGEYLVAMVGFKPHFPYLMGLDPALETPRLPSPRTRIPAGAVAIGGAQTGIYPQESPGGWNLIGSCDPELLKQVLPGDRLKMKAVDKL